MSDTTYLDDTELFARSARAIEALTNEIARLRDEHAKLLGFVRGVMDYWPDGGVDWVDLHDMAEKNGILITETVTEQCCEDCSCSSDAEFPTTCYRLADFVRNENGS